MPPILETLRPHQWSKNILLAVPALMGQVWMQPAVVRDLALAFIAFCLAASGGYIINDLLDIEADRKHPEKRKRPLPAGRLPLAWGYVGGPVLVAAGAGLAFAACNRPFALLVLTYVGLSLAYSVFLKRLLLVDVMILATLYALRLLAGGAAVHVEVSSWLLAFSMFFFVSLAFAKRLTELQLLGGGGETRNATRAYVAQDRTAFAAAGPSAGMLSVLVLALYISSDTIRARYDHPDFLWLLCPLLLYWVLRVWFFTLRGELHHDPVVFALRDRVSYAVATAVVAVVFLAYR